MLSSNIKAIDIVLAISNMTAHSLNVAITPPALTVKTTDTSYVLQV